MSADLLGNAEASRSSDREPHVMGRADIFNPLVPTEGEGSTFFSQPQLQELQRTVSGAGRVNLGLVYSTGVNNNNPGTKTPGTAHRTPREWRNSNYGLLGSQPSGFTDPRRLRNAQQLGQLWPTIAIRIQ